MADLRGGFFGFVMIK